jgi:hypothetical protein
MSQDPPPVLEYASGRSSEPARFRDFAVASLVALIFCLLLIAVSVPLALLAAMVCAATFALGSAIFVIARAFFPIRLSEQAAFNLGFLSPLVIAAVASAYLQ